MKIINNLKEAKALVEELEKKEFEEKQKKINITKENQLEEISNLIWWYWIMDLRSYFLKIYPSMAAIIIYSDITLNYDKSLDIVGQEWWIIDKIHNILIDKTKENVI